MNGVLLLAGLLGLLAISENSWLNGIAGYNRFRSSWFYPYEKRNGKYKPVWVGDWSEKKSGVYFIRRSSDKKIVYVGSAVKGGLKKTIYRHFQTWTDKQKNGVYFDRTTYDKSNYQVKFLVCSPTDAARIEKYFIRKYQPSGNPIKYKNLSDIEVEKNEAAVDLVVNDAENISVENLPW